ncbi:hypothetical protein BJF85_01365 [Saccharomonospora sp. CUA-673]|nr:hypothetical protein BJF85_01365 [Saccharomonospora sp. CUA-673]
MSSAGRVRRRWASAGCAAALVVVGLPGAAAGQAAEESTSWTVEHVAGGTEAGFSGDGHAAVDARIGGGGNLAVGAGGAVYLPDDDGDRVRVIGTDGVIDTVPGTRAADSATGTPRAVAVGDGALFVAGDDAVVRRSGGNESVLATVGDVVPSAEDLAVDDDGNVYVAGSDTVARIPAGGGEPEVIAGGGRVPPQRLDGADATRASLPAHLQMAVRGDGTVYLRPGESELYRVDPDGALHTLRGPHRESGFAGDGGPVDEAQFGGRLAGPAIGPDGRLYVLDARNSVVRVIGRDGVVTSLTPPAITPDEAGARLAVSAEGAVYVRSGPSVERLVEVDRGAAGQGRAHYPSHYSAEEPGTVYPVAGADEGATVGEELRQARQAGSPDPDVEQRVRVATGPRGVTYYADSAAHRVWRVERDGGVEVVAGTGEAGFAGDDGPAGEAQLDEPTGVAVGPDGAVYIADSANDRVRRVGGDGVITTVAGDGSRVEDDADGRALDDERATEVPVSPTDVDVAGDGVVYVAEGPHDRISRVGTDGTIDIVAGSGERDGAEADGFAATEALVRGPHALTVSREGRVFFLEGGDRLVRPAVRMVDASGVLYTVAGTASPGQRFGADAGFAGDGGPARDALLNGPRDLAVRADGTLYVADTDNARVRAIDAGGTIRTVAGTGERADGEDGARARSAPLDAPQSLDVAADGSLRLAAGSAGAVRAVSGGELDTVAELDVDGGVGVQRPATEVVFHPRMVDGLAVDQDGSLLLVDGSGPLMTVNRHGMFDFESDVDGLGSGPVSAVDVGPDGAWYVAVQNVVYRVMSGADGDGDVVAVPVAGGGLERDEDVGVDTWTPRAARRCRTDRRDRVGGGGERAVRGDGEQRVSGGCGWGDPAVVP